jgi:hypothetical protein
MGKHSFMSAPAPAGDILWARGIQAGLAAAGLVQAGDTGQTNMNSVTHPGTSSHVLGYQIWRMNDALQATAPVFIRVEYFTSLWRAGIRVTVGKGSNGTGTITNVLVPATQGTLDGGSGSTFITEYPSFIGGDGSSVAMVFWPGFSNGNIMSFFFLERSRDQNGNPTADGIAWGWARNGGVSVHVLGYTGAINSAKHAFNVSFPVMLPQVINGVSAASNIGSHPLSSDGVTAPVFPIPFAAPGVTPWVSNVLTVIAPGDATSVSVIQAATINGAVRTYRAFSVTNAGPVAGGGYGYNCQPAILWQD